MPPRLTTLGRRARPLGLLFALADVWARIPPEQRRLIAQQARKHGPRLASRAVKTARARAAGRRVS